MHIVAHTLALGIFLPSRGKALAVTSCLHFSAGTRSKEDDPARATDASSSSNVGCSAVLLAAVDTAGRPSVAYRAEHVSRRARRTAQKKTRRARKMAAKKVDAVRKQLPQAA